MSFWESLAVGFAASSLIGLGLQAKALREIRKLRKETQHRVEGHKWEIVHHYGDDGKHWCPTGFVECRICREVKAGPIEAPECLLWGKWDRDALGRQRS